MLESFGTWTLHSVTQQCNSPPTPSRFNDSDHLKDPDLYSDKSDREGEQDHEESDPEGLEKSEESDSDTSERQDDSYVDLDPNEHLRETPYLEQSHEELGEVGGPSIRFTFFQTLLRSP